MSNVVFLRRSHAYRHAAVEMMRRARAMPPGPARRTVRRCALALRDLARTQAWLEGEVAEPQAARR